MLKARARSACASGVARVKIAGVGVVVRWRAVVLRVHARRAKGLRTGMALLLLREPLVISGDLSGDCARNGRSGERC
jgi:hypothetical protein